MNIYVSNISFHTTEETLVEMFSVYGKVTAVKILNDSPTDGTKRFGFVEMQSTAEAHEAIKMLDGKEIQGRALRVSQARDRFSRNVKN
jgi:RNA recognition motif-containing protein